MTAGDAMTQARSRSYEDVLQLVGNTPLIRLRRTTEGIRTPVYGKAEFMNPGGSVKDRIGLAMIEAAEREGTLGPGGVIVEGTSGNTGLALAMAAVAKGYRCVFTLPDKMSHEKVKLLRAFGAEVIITPSAVPPDHPEHYVTKAKIIAEETPGAVLADQFYNPANPEAHYRTTGPELWDQTEGRITHFVCGAGTGGTISGAGRYLKEKNPEIQVVGVDPEGSVHAGFFHTGEVPEGQPYLVEGLGGEKVPGTLDLSVVDDYLVVSDYNAFHTTLQLSRQEGLFVGGSSGLIAYGALEVARRVDDPDALVVTLLCDWGERYLSKVYDREWMKANGFLQEEAHTVYDLLQAKPTRTDEVVAVSPTDRVRSALKTITTEDVSQLPVMLDGECIGSVTEGELMSQVLEDPKVLDRPVEEVMTSPFPVVESYHPLEQATRLLSRENPAVLVRENGKVSGIVTRYDVVRVLTEET